MKTCKRMIALMLAVVMMAMLAVSASAATILTVNWKGEMSGFPVLYKGVENKDGYVKVLQRFLLAYNESTYVLIKNSGVDGSFGGKTLQAVYAFQGAEEISVDGRVGPGTWTAIGNCLVQNNARIQYTGKRNSSVTPDIIMLTQSGSTVYMYTYSEGNYRFEKHFHSVT